MNGIKKEDEAARNSLGVAPRSACALCGRDDSGAWYWSDELKRVICVDCYWRRSAPPPTSPAPKRR